MFTDITSIEAIKLKLILAAVFILIIAGFVFAWHEKNVEIENQRNELAKQTVVNKMDQQTADTVAGAGDITQKSAVDTTKAIQDLSTQLKAAKDDTDQKIAAIEKKYATLPKTPANLKQQNDAVSFLLLQGMWNVYCKGNPDDEKCISVSTPPVIPAASITH